MPNVRETKVDAKQDWKTPYTDNDRFKPLCTKPTAKSDFACTKIKCIHDRALNTNDFYDF